MYAIANDRMAKSKYTSPHTNSQFSYMTDEWLPQTHKHNLQIKSDSSTSAGNFSTHKTQWKICSADFSGLQVHESEVFDFVTEMHMSVSSANYSYVGRNEELVIARWRHRREQKFQRQSEREREKESMLNTCE